MSETNATHVAIAHRDDSGRLWFVCRDASLGNVMRTSDPLRALAWSCEAEARLWADGLPASAQAHIAGRKLLVVSLSVSVSDPLAEFEFVVPVAIPDAPTPPPAAVIRPLPQRRRTKAS